MRLQLNPGIVDVLARKAHDMIIRRAFQEWRLCILAAIHEQPGIRGRWKQYYDAVWDRLRPRPADVVGMERIVARFNEIREHADNDNDAAETVCRELLVAGSSSQLVHKLYEFNRHKDTTVKAAVGKRFVHVEGPMLPFALSEN